MVYNVVRTVRQMALDKLGYNMEVMVVYLYIDTMYRYSYIVSIYSNILSLYSSITYLYVVHNVIYTL